MSRTKTAPAKPQFAPNASIVQRDRRRRARIDTAAVGYLVLESDAGKKQAEPWEVRVHDLSRLGVGFISCEPMKLGDMCRIRIGMGPMRLARRMRVVSCEPDSANTFRIGAEFA